MRPLAAGIALAIALSLTATASARTTSVGVGLHEYRVAPYRDRVLPGYIKFNLTNRGEDPHNFVVRTRRGRVVARTGDLRPGAVRSLRVKLRYRARYVLACTLGDHERRGMRARLTVSRKRPSR